MARFRLMPSIFPFPTLDRYVLGRFSVIYASNLFSFTFLYVLIDLVSNFDRFAKHNDGLADVLAACARYYGFIIPVTLCQVLGPVVTVAAALFTVTAFQRSNELVPIFACGQSLQRTFLSIVVASLVVSGGVFTLQEYWIPSSVDKINSALQAKEGEDTHRNLNYFDRDRGNLILFREYNRFARTAKGALVLPVAQADGPQVLVDAATAEWIDLNNETGYWILKDARVQEYDSSDQLVAHRIGDSERALPLLVRTFPEYELKTSLMPVDIEAREEEVYMSLDALARRIADSPNKNAWIIKYMARFSAPLANFVLVLLGLPVIVFFGNRNVFVGAFLAVVVATAYFAMHSFFQELGVRDLIPARVAAWIGPSLFIALGATAYREMKS